MLVSDTTIAVLGFVDAWKVISSGLWIYTFMLSLLLLFVE